MSASPSRVLPAAAGIHVVEQGGYDSPGASPAAAAAAGPRLMRWRGPAWLGAGAAPGDDGGGGGGCGPPRCPLVEEERRTSCHPRRRL